MVAGRQRGRAGAAGGTDGAATCSLGIGLGRRVSAVWRMGLIRLRLARMTGGLHICRPPESRRRTGRRDGWPRAGMIPAAVRHEAGQDPDDIQNEMGESRQDADGIAGVGGRRPRALAALAGAIHPAASPVELGYSVRITTDPVPNSIVSVLHNTHTAPPQHQPWSR